MKKTIAGIFGMLFLMAFSLSVFGSHSPPHKAEKSKIEFSKSSGGETSHFYFDQLDYLAPFAIVAPKLKHIEPAVVHLRHYALGEYNCVVSALSSNRKYKNIQRYWCMFMQSNAATA